MGYPPYYDNVEEELVGKLHDPDVPDEEEINGNDD